MDMMTTILVIIYKYISLVGIIMIHMMLTAAKVNIMRGTKISLFSRETEVAPLPVLCLSRA